MCHAKTKILYCNLVQHIIYLEYFILIGHSWFDQIFVQNHVPENRLK